MDHRLPVIFSASIFRLRLFKFGFLGFPVTSSIRHFIFCVTSSQREKLSLHTRHFIQVHYIPCGTSYQSHFIPVHFIPRPLHTSHFIPIVTSYQCTSYQGHFISVHFIPKSLHTEVISYQSQISHFVPMHCIPVQFILVISCRSLYTSPLIHVHFI